MKTRSNLILPISLVSLIFMAAIAPPEVPAHGAVLQHRLETGIRVEARYDGGQPMAGARVVIYAPDDPARPWLRGQADEQGRFSFVPDPEKPGTWSIQARQAGHGAMIHIPLAASERAGAAGEIPSPAATSSPVTPAQRWLMALAIIWGCIGTALFFLRRRRP